jgi:hypothetical protein
MGGGPSSSMIRKLEVIVYFRKVFSSTKIQIVLLFSFKFSHFLNLRACKNDIFILWSTCTGTCFYQWGRGMGGGPSSFLVIVRGRKGPH